MKKNFAKKLDFEIPLELQDHIITVIQGETEAIIHTSYPVHPNGFPLVIDVYKDMPMVHINDVTIHPQSRLQIAGQVQDANISMEIKGLFGQIGYLLYPSTPYYLFHKSGNHFLNTWRDFEKSVPIPLNDLHKDLSGATTPLDRIPPLLDFFKLLLDNRLPAIAWIDDALRQIYQLGGKITQETIAEQSGVSLRHFRRKFKEVVGVSPKYFCKVIQLNVVFELLNASEDEKLHLLALDCGYYDQAHFINDFKRLIGQSPRNFLNGEHSYVKTYMGRAGG